MKVRDVMSCQVVGIRPEEDVTVAARTLEHYNIGALPVYGTDRRLHGLVTDRDLVVRCMASGRERAKVSEVMTRQVVCAVPDMELREAAALMGTRQIRRMPVVESGRVCGILTLADLARAEAGEALAALEGISDGISRR